MAGEFGIVYPLWAHGEGEATLLERVIGEVAVEHVTIPVITGARTQFRHFGPRETPYFHTEGGWHFPPETKAYAASGVKPRAAEWCGHRDVLRKVCDVARHSGLDVNFRIDIPSLPRLVENSPELAQRNAWGDTYVDWGPCLSNPAARELFVASINDALRYKPDAFELVNLRLDSVSPALAGYSLDRPFGPGLELCFCPACRQIAAESVDADQAARSVRALTEKHASKLHPGRSADELLKELRGDPVLREYVAVRLRSVERWLETLAAKYPEHGFFHGPLNFDSAAVGRGGVAGFDRLATFDADCWLEDAPEEGEKSIITVLEDTAVEMDLWFAWRHGPDALVRVVLELVARGVRYFDFADIDETPPQTIDWLRQAVRYARRT